MTSNYGQYIHPERWPVPPHAIGWAYIGRASSRDTTTVYGAECVGSDIHTHVLCVVPTLAAGRIADAITSYCEACRNLIG